MHIAIILDGNRRWAEEHNMLKHLGHAKGAETLKSLIKSAKDLDIHTFTFFTLSTQNLQRPKIEVDELFRLCRKYFLDIAKDNKDARVRFIGNLDLLPEDLQQNMKEIMEDTKDNTPYTLNFCVAYGGREEIVQAVNKAIEKGGKVDVESFGKYFDLQESPDLIIRTGGIQRTSNFLPWQSIYSEWIFLDKFWPDFTIDDLKQAIADFSERQRNFGK